MCPAKPAKELKSINRAATPDAFLTLVQLAIIIIGERKIPPPTPISPEIKPMNEPPISPYTKGICFVGCGAGL